jgi:hypothetical protein
MHGSVRGVPGNRYPYRDVRTGFSLCDSDRDLLDDLNAVGI